QRDTYPARSMQTRASRGLSALPSLQAQNAPHPALIGLANRDILSQLLLGPLALPSPQVS
ncbi:MAG TPA: hypothetical protein VMW79_02040, partial [Anaerolineae bacterium]|nr:hypothetical protein [Anaerolineae bacterium]